MGEVDERRSREAGGGIQKKKRASLPLLAVVIIYAVFKMQRARQLELPLHGHGGARRGAGRPRTSTRVSHAARPRFDGRRAPLHVTIRVARDVWNLRSQRGFRCVEQALSAERARGALRVVHFSVQGNHVHLVVEARDRAVLSRRMQGFGIRLARRINAMMGRRRGRVFADRYHARVLRTPREVRRVIAYVLQNFAKHVARRNPHGASELGPDRFSSGAHREACSPPRTWLLARGWRRASPLARTRAHGAIERSAL